MCKYENFTFSLIPTISRGGQNWDEEWRGDTGRVSVLYLNSFKLIITIGNDNSEWDSFLCLRSSYLVVAVVHLVIISSFTYQLLIEFLLCAWPYSFRAQEKTSRITDILVTCLWWPSLKGKETALRI